MYRRKLLSLLGAPLGLFAGIATRARTLSFASAIPVHVLPVSNGNDELVASRIVDDGSVFVVGNVNEDAAVITMDTENASIVLGDAGARGNGTMLTVDDLTNTVRMANLRTSDPHIVNALYSVGGVLHISGG